MNVTITLGDLQDLNSIKGMLRSTDKETNNLGFEMLKANSVFKKFSDMTFTPKPGKEIPVIWYIRKTEDVKSHESALNYSTWTSIIGPVVDAIISGSNQFKDRVYIRFDRKNLESSSSLPEPLLEF